MQVGVRQLRDELRKWLEAVRQGDEVIVTERGKPIARLIGASTPPPLERLIADGIVTPAQRPRRPSRAHRRVKAKGSVSELVARQRR
jgi:prevent-host-death family protein